MPLSEGASDPRGNGVVSVAHGGATQRLGRAQKFILEQASATPVGVTALAKTYFQVEEPTRAQKETMRRAIRTLHARGLVARSATRTTQRYRVAGRTVVMVAACDGEHCQACYYGAAWYPPTRKERPARSASPFAKEPAAALRQIEEVYGAGPELDRAKRNGYHQWTPIRDAGRKTAPRIATNRHAWEMAVRTPLTDEETRDEARRRLALYRELGFGRLGREELQRLVEVAQLDGVEAVHFGANPAIEARSEDE